MRSWPSAGRYSVRPVSKLFRALENIKRISIILYLLNNFVVFPVIDDIITVLLLWGWWGSSVNYKLKIALCDDENKFLEIEKEIIAAYLDKKGVPFCLDCYHSGEELLSDKESVNVYDLIILDVEMPGIDGITVAKTIRENNDKVNIAFLSAHMNYSTDGYHVRAIRFMLKTTDDLKDYMHECLDRVLESIDFNDRIVTLDFSIGKRTLKISDIIYLKSTGNYTTFITTASSKETYLTRSSLKKTTDMMESLGFISINAKETVNVSHISSVVRYLVTLDDGTAIQISQKKYNDVCRAFTLYRGKNV